MAVPTIATVLPAAGLTRGGDMIVITGTNFRTVPTVAAPALYLGGAEQQTVGVWFGGVRAPYAGTVDGTELHVTVPEWSGAYSTLVTEGGRQRLKDALPTAVDVRVANLDDAGVEIVGETVTSASAYTYGRVSLVQTTRVESVIERLIDQLRRHVHLNTWWTKSRDFDEAPEDLEDYIQEKGLPLVRLQGPDWEWDENHWKEDGTESELVAGEFTQTRRQRAIKMEFLLDVWSGADHPNELINLSVAVTDFFHLLPWIILEVGGEDWKYPLNLLAHPAFDIGPKLDGLKNFRCSLEIEGVDVGDADLAIIERGWEVDTFDVDRGDIGP